MRRYLVLGAGAVGCALGGLLAHAGARVSMVARGPRLDALRREGVRVVTPSESFALDVSVMAQPEGLERDDVVLLCVQSQDSAAALEALRMATSYEVAVVCMQNGVATEEVALARFAHVYGGMVFWPLACPEPGCVHIHSERGVVDVGCHPSGLDAVAEDIAADLRAAGIDARADASILRTKYGKLLLNLANALEALGGRAARASKLRERVTAEAIGCYGAAGIDYLPIDALLARVAEVKDLPIAGERRSGGSMWQSLERQSGSIESAFLNGAIVELGARHGLPTPLNSALLALSERAAREGWPPGKLTVSELKQALA